MPNTLPLAMLIELAQNKTDEASRRLGQLQRAQISATQKLELLVQYRQEYCDQLQLQMQDGVPSSRWRNFQHFIGTLDGANVHPREDVIEALKHQAAAVILAHNHPSGVAEPSQADELITKRLRDALSLVDIRVLDHIIVANNSTVSFAERGIL